MSKSSFKCMGVINLTPNSFYTPSQHDNSELVYQKMIQWKEFCQVIDLGAESTAPMNQSINEAEELNRFKSLAIPAMKKYFSNFKTLPFISIDTYRASTFIKVAEEIRQFAPSAQLIWNDVSGIFNDEVNHVLQLNQKNSYILCHNRVPERERTGQHREYAQNKTSEIVAEVINFFADARVKSQALGITSRVSFDINFGFAKSREENLWLLRSMDKVMNQYPEHPWCLGLSHKSFLKLIENDDDHHYRELVHFHLLAVLKTKIPEINLLVRVHNPQIVQLVNSLPDMTNI